MKAHILYSDSLVRKQTPQKAILLLKCLAKVFPPLPFESIQYTKLLQKARTIQDLDMLNSVDHDTPNSVAYIESITNQRSPPGLKGRRLLIQQAIGGNSQGRKVSFNEIKNHQQEIIHLREKMRRPKKYLTLSILTEFENEEVEAILQSRGHINRNSGLPNGENAFVGFSICSDATFLYKIAKIAAIYNTNIEDGICAIHDYLILLVFERDHNRIDKLTVKALYYKAYLLCRNSNNQVARGIIQDISASLTSKKREKAQQFLEI